jgi:hypothetical protein
MRWFVALVLVGCAGAADEPTIEDSGMFCDPVDVDEGTTDACVCEVCGVLPPHDRELNGGDWSVLRCEDGWVLQVGEDGALPPEDVSDSAALHCMGY